MKGNMKRITATALSTSMVLGMSITAFADAATPSNATPSNATVEAPIYSLDVTNVVVPTTYEVAFNPSGLTVTTGTSTTSTDQVLARNYGIVNKSSKDKVVTVDLQITDLNDDQINFMDTNQEVTDAEEEEFAVYLTAIPADTTEVKVKDPAQAADKDTAPADVASVSMTKAGGKEVVLKSGSNKISFLLEKAIYTPISGKEVTLGTSTGNNVESNYELTGLAADGKGITAFTFGGSMKASAKWERLSHGIEITGVYTWEDAPSSAAVVTGTGAMVKTAPSFTTGSGVGQFTYDVGGGNDGLKAIKKVEMDNKGKMFDGYNATASWTAATDTNNTVTLKPGFLGFYTTAYPNDATREATITYETNGGETKTATVNVKIR